MDASVLRRWSIRDAYRWLSTLTPIHTFGGQSIFGLSCSSRAARLVRTWKLCQ